MKLERVKVDASQQNIEKRATTTDFNCQLWQYTPRWFSFINYRAVEAFYVL